MNKFYTIPSSVEKLTFDNAGVPDLQQAKPVSKQPMCDHMGDADSCKDGNAGAVKSEFSNRTWYKLSLALTLASIIFLSPLSAAEVNPSKNPLERLKQGNLRYVTSTTVCHDDWTAKRTALVQNQRPFAIIVSCSDSRVPPEIIFDQTLGALFVVRVAGNVVDDFAIGSIEYGVNVLGANLVLVLGHSNCGAVDAALKGLKFDNHIQSVLTAIQPAVNSVKGESGNLLEKAIKMNVRNVEEKLKSSKPVLANLIDKGSLKIVGGYYDLESGKVEFLEKS